MESDSKYHVVIVLAVGAHHSRSTPQAWSGTAVPFVHVIAKSESRGAMGCLWHAARYVVATCCSCPVLLNPVIAVCTDRSRAMARPIQTHFGEI
eukprot:3658963-Karenia_brevis.AAC.1